MLFRAIFALTLLAIFTITTAIGSNAYADQLTSEQVQRILDDVDREMNALRAASTQPGLTVSASASAATQPTSLRPSEQWGQLLLGGLSTWLGKPSLRLFQPNARIYFDTGEDEDGEADIFENGALVPTITLAEIRFTNRLFNDSFANLKDKAFKTDDGKISPWSWGFATGIGASIAAETGEDSTAPVVLATIGVFLEYEFNNPALTTDKLKNFARVAEQIGLNSSGPTVGIEAGWAYGISADENFGDNDDSAFYVGVTAYFPF